MCNKSISLLASGCVCAAARTTLLLVAVVTPSDALAQRLHEQWRDSGSQRRAVEGTRNTPSGRSANTADSPPSSPADIGGESRAQSQQLIAEAIAANREGITFYTAGNWAEAVSAFEEAARKGPDDPVIQDNLSKAQQRLREYLDAQQAAESARRTLAEFVQSLGTSHPARGLDFDGLHAAPSNPVRTHSPAALDFGDPSVVRPKATAKRDSSPSVLEFGDPMVVDARPVPSGLPTPVDQAIASVYASAPPGVLERIRKGFQAVLTNDWNAARAWFQDALNRDPGNAGIASLLACLDNDSKHPSAKPASVSQEELDRLADFMLKMMVEEATKKTK